MAALGPNPIHCLRCNLEVRPERLALTARETDDVAHWRLTYDAIDALELASGEYEQWARERLLDLNSPPNVEGRKVAAMLNEKERCYFWIWQPQADDGWIPPSACPYCGEALAGYDEGIFPQLLCERDSVVVVGR
jgi:predicted  nucleic acid-binding Zn ribbon protein